MDNDNQIAKLYLMKNNLNFVLVKGNQVLKGSSGRGIKPIHETFKENKDLFKGASIADRVIGKAAAIFLVNGGIKSLYTDLISDTAMEILNLYDIEVEYLKKVPMILNRTKDDICPIEKLSSTTEDLSKIMEDIDIFSGNIKRE